jgi:hypothetical protein
MEAIATDADDFTELVRHPKYARIVADLVADVNLECSPPPRRLSAGFESIDETRIPASQRWVREV